MLSAIVANEDPKCWNGQATQVEKNQKKASSARKAYHLKKQKEMAMIEDIWDKFPPNGLEKVKIECLKDPIQNYGLHQIDLGFDKLEMNCEMDVGTRSLGKRYENERHVRKYNREMCPFSAKHWQFLEAVDKCILYHFPKYKPTISQFMRVNLVVGAMTGDHTDTLRGATPNFILIEPESGFHLRVRMFPNFRDSVVIYKGQYYIPHTHCPQELVMIGLKGGMPHYYYIFQSETIEDLQPYGEFNDFIVVGIKEGKLQVITWEYEVHDSPKELPTVRFEDALELASQHKVELPDRYHMWRIIGKDNKPVDFFGWRNSHRWIAGTPHMCRRIHVFYRPIREETPAARIRRRNETGELMNATVAGNN